MFHTLGLAAAGTGFAFLMTTLGAATVYFFPGQIRGVTRKVLIGFAAGVMTAASVWSLILPAIDQSGSGPLPAWTPPAVGILLGALFLAAMDGAILRLRTRAPLLQTVSHENTLLMAAITMHNIPEGMAVGLAFALAADGKGLPAAATLALGIGVQNFPEGAAISLPLRQEGQSRGKAFFCGMMSGAVEPLFGVLVVFLASWAVSLMPWLLGFAAGAMLYVVAEELIPQGEGKPGTLGFFLGFLLMMILDVALG